ncbi:DUF5362 family protein [Kordia zhangzhouensis]|uniref:DUF5362 family protein n=1 Tax=Kordia zhangzhouensis TaxID=1620405 RepID=UPI00069A0C27|nr:DUF5362 family protein [Kordia zhangzhouensis]
MPIRKEENNSVFDNFELRLNESSKKFLRETSKWAFVLSIVGFVIVGLFVFMAVFFFVMLVDVRSNLNPFHELGMPAWYFGLVYLLIAIIYFFPILYLYKFSRKMKSALIDKSTEDLTAAFSNLRSHYKFIGIIVLIIVGIYILLFGIGLVTALLQ